MAIRIARTRNLLPVMQVCIVARLQHALEDVAHFLRAGTLRDLERGCFKEDYFEGGMR